MNAINQAKTAYSTSASPVRTNSGTEYEAFCRTTRRLKNAAIDTPGGFSETVHALHENRQLWTVLAADVASADNALPEQLRAQIFYLAEFTTQHSRRVLRGDATLDALIEINTAIMRGLRNQAAAA